MTDYLSTKRGPGRPPKARPTARFSDAEAAFVWRQQNPSGAPLTAEDFGNAVAWYEYRIMVFRAEIARMEKMLLYAHKAPNKTASQLEAILAKVNELPKKARKAALEAMLSDDESADDDDESADDVA
jgi:hypothetical protein